MNKLFFLIIVIGILMIGANRGQNNGKAEIYYQKSLTLVDSAGFYTDPKKAIEYLTKALFYYDSEPVFYANRALAYSQISEKSKSIKDINKAIALDPSTDYYITKMFLYCKAKDRINALSEAHYICEIKKDCSYQTRLLDERLCQ